MATRFATSGTHGLFPKNDAALAVGDERHAAVLRNDDGEAVGMVRNETIGSAVARPDIFHVVRLRAATFRVERAMDALRRGELGRHFGAEPEQPEALVDDDGAVDGSEIRDHAAPFEDGLLERLELRAR